jgi:hypothetical protein
MNKKINISIIGTRGYPYVYSGYETFVKQLSERLVLKIVMSLFIVIRDFL